MAKFYTGTGDAGQTSLYSGERVPKDSQRIEAYGTLDELQAFLGMARALTASQECSHDLLEVESKLMDAMAELATLGGESRITSSDVMAIEKRIDHYTAALPEGFKWSVPGDSQASAALHVARTVSRRAEREALRLADSEAVATNLLIYLNRISDLCYALARYEDEVVGADQD